MKESDIRDVEVGADQDGARLDTFLASALPDRSRSQVQKLIKEGRISGGTTSLRPSTPVRAGQRFRVEMPEPTLSSVPPENIPLRVLYEDTDVLVLDKPAGMVVHPGAGHATGTLVNALLHHVEDLSGV